MCIGLSFWGEDWKKGYKKRLTEFSEFEYDADHASFYSSVYFYFTVTLIQFKSVPSWKFKKSCDRYIKHAVKQYCNWQSI